MWVALSVSLAFLKQKIKVKMLLNEKNFRGKICIIIPMKHFREQVETVCLFCAN